MSRIVPFAIFVCFVFCSSAQTSKTGVVKSAPGLSAITEKDLKTDLYEMAGDHFRGREAGTVDELKASIWWAEKLRATGLKPAGDDGTFFQFFNMKRARISQASRVSIGDQTLELWKDVLVAQTVPAVISAPIIYAGSGTTSELDKLDLKGKAVALKVSADGINLAVSLPERRYPGYVLRKYGTALYAQGVAAIIFIADEMGEMSWSQVVPALSRGSYDVDAGTSAAVVPRPPVFWVHAGALDMIRSNGAMLKAEIEVERFDYPSVNIVATIDGSDPVLKKEFVLYSGHTDHDGVRQPYGNDSIYNGADDNATVNVALLAIARALKRNPGKRSALFVWHGAEERGLLGSKWFASNPTVPGKSIVAVLNGDMIGYNNPDSAALLGMQPPHRNSSELVTAAVKANNDGPRFKLDTLWDKPEHVEGWYFRSDHLSYARAGYPAIFYTTLLHPLYHTPMDEPKIIDIAKLRRMTEWMYRTGWTIANAPRRPGIDPHFKLER
ncbi:M28 family peptidase [Segetibacter sp. 3557_3]|nr:M28 family peptidase [Segetibacter sp. 3557_3]